MTTQIFSGALYFGLVAACVYGLLWVLSGKADAGATIYDRGLDD